MQKKYKRVFSINNDLGYRNYTVRDLIDLKGKKKLTQVRVTTVEEALAAEEELHEDRNCPKEVPVDVQ